MTPIGSPQPRRSMAPLIIGIVCAVLLVIALVIAGIGVGAYYFTREAGTDAETTGTNSPPPGLSADADYLRFGSESSTQVDVYIDFSCPHCAEFAEVNDADLKALADDGTIDLRIHPLPMMNAQSAGYSERAANAATCMYTQDADLFWDMSDALFAAQADGPALSSEDLAQTAEGLGANADTLECITGETYLSWIDDTVGPQGLARISGTPAIYIDDVQWDGDYTQAGALSLAIVGE